MDDPTRRALPADDDHDPGRFAANRTATAEFSRVGDVHGPVARRPARTAAAAEGLATVVMDAAAHAVPGLGTAELTSRTTAGVAAASSADGRHDRARSGGSHHVHHVTGSGPDRPAPLRSARPAAIGVAVTGLLLTLTAGRRRPPRWWLWWVPAKPAPVVATVVVTVSVSPVALRFAVDHADTVGSPAYTDTRYSLVLVAIHHVVMIGAAALLAIFRPGARFRGAHRSGVAS